MWFACRPAYTAAKVQDRRQLCQLTMPRRIYMRELKEEIDHIFVRNEEYNSLMVSILSFGFKNGIPADADLVFDPASS